MKGSKMMMKMDKAHEKEMSKMRENSMSNKPLGFVKKHDTRKAK